MAQIAQFSTNGGRWTETTNSSGDWTNLLGDTGGVIAWSLVGAGVSDATGLGMFSGQSVDFYDVMTEAHFDALIAAFDAWSQAGNIEFIQLPDTGGDIGTGDYPTIRVSLGDIDGANGTLGQAIFPDVSAAGGDIVFDSGDGTFFNADVNNFFLTALHEIGHALGLDHETTNTAIMNPTIDTSMTGLQNDDIDGIQTIYGAQDFGPSTFYMEPTQVHLTIYEGISDVTLVGNTLDNRMTGSILSENFQGGAGHDNINGDEGDDQLFGGSGNDQLIGGIGNDTMSGNTGNDHYFIDAAGDVVSEGVAANQGIDTIYSTATSYTLADNVGIEYIVLQDGAQEFHGNNVAQNLAGNAADNIMSGGAGNDLLNGNGGTDTLSGGVGNDILIGGAGDTLRGNADNDTYYIEDSSVVVEEVDGEGIDQINQNTATYVMTAYVENGTMLAPAVSLTGNDLANSLIGNSGANTIDGGDGNDKIQAGDGNDTLIGSNGNDQLIGGTGADAMTGGLGHDHYFVDNSGDTITEAVGTAEGNDSIYYSGASYTLADNVGVENVWFQAGAQNFTGNNLAQSFAGNDIANTINGGGGNDVMSGNGGNDILFGGMGADFVFGNAGADKFAFNTLAEGGAGDRIADFNSLQGDQIQIDDTGFGISSISLAVGATVGASSYGVTTGAFFLDNTGAGSGNLYFDADGDGAGAAVLLTHLTGVTSLATTDFVLA